MRKPHVAFISETKATYGLLTGQGADVVGGAEVQQTLLASELLKLGYSVTFLVADFGQPEKVVTSDGIALIKTRPPGGQSNNPIQYLADIRRLFRAMDAADADIYYQRTSATITGITAAFCKLRSKLFVFSIASNMDLDGTARKLLKPHFHVLYQFGLRHARAIIVQTDDQKELLKRNFRRDGIVIRSTYSRPTEEEAALERNGILWVGNFRHVRRPELFLDLAERLPEYQFIMVGGSWLSEPLLFDEMKARAKSISNIKLVGAVPYDHVGYYFGAAKLFVNTSSIEGFPNTYLQAWSRGLPIVATFDADGLISKHHLGCHCDSLDELADAARDFMEDETLRSEAGRRAMKYVEENHSIEAVTAAYDALFKSLCKKSN